RDWQRYQQGGSPGDWSSSGNPFGSGNVDFSDLFETLFGGAGNARAGQRSTGGYRADGQDVEQQADITLEEAFTGTQRMVQFHTSNGQPRSITVRIPPGVDTGSRVRVANEGGPGIGGGKR